MNARTSALSALVLVAATIAIPAAAVQRTFVASFGNDANTASNCGFTNPCRGFTAAHGVTDSGGEIIALDAAGYGAITITKSITITSNSGFYAGISAASGNAVTIATPGVKVVLRGLNLNGIGGYNGIEMTDGLSLVVENCVISNFGNDGIFFLAPNATARIANSTIRGNVSSGIEIRAGSADVSNSKALNNGYVGVWARSAGTATLLSASDTVSSGNQWGFVASGSQGVLTAIRATASGNAVNGFMSNGGTITVGSSMATGNGIGMESSSGTFETLANNISRSNTTNTLGTFAPVAGS